MKYIRTKDGIFENEYIHIIMHSNGKCLMKYNDKFYKPPLKVKQADTIEELCDEFVIKVNVHNIVIHDLKSVLMICDAYKDYNIPYVIYGAIWTEKGLIYVAKMNKKGELELL